MRSLSALRDRATRYLAMALIAHERGDSDLAEALTQRAAHLMEQAEAAEAGPIIPPASPQVIRPNAQPQQQIQPKDGNE
jgi:hypothetical protein